MAREKKTRISHKITLYH